MKFQHDDLEKFINALIGFLQSLFSKSRTINKNVILPPNKSQSVPIEITNDKVGPIKQEPTSQLTTHVLTNEVDSNPIIDQPAIFQFEADPLKHLICTQKFGERPEFYAKLGSPKGHNGLDFRTWVNGYPNNWKQDVYAVMSGKILEAREDIIYGKGNYIRIDHGTRGQTVYLHLSSIEVIEGNAVIAGEPIGISGNSGSASEGPHLHFSYKLVGFDKNNGYLGCADPSEYFVGKIIYL